MNHDIVIELRFFIISLLSGAILILTYDVLRILRRLIPHKGVIINLEDFIYWVLAGLFLFIMMYRYNHGMIRAFSVLGILCGMMIYQYTLSRTVVKVITRLIRLLFAPAVFVIKQIKRVISFLAKKIKKVMALIKKRMINLGKWYKIKKEARKAKKLAEKSKKLEENTKKQAEVKKKRAEKELQQAKKKAKKNIKTAKKNAVRSNLFL